MQQQPTEPVLESFIGSLDALERAAMRQSKWPLVVLQPSTYSALTPSSTSSSRTAWRSNALHRRSSLPTTSHLIDNIILWRRTAASSDAERYTAFFPVDGLPHIALLDPRSGERLCVWGNEEGANMDGNQISEQLWSKVQQNLVHFLESHSLEDDALGPMHTQDKPWAVRTRRISQTDGTSASSSVMEDEEAAIAAAIKASLADAGLSSDTFNDDDSDMDRSENSTSTDGNQTLDELVSASSNDDQSDERSNVDLDIPDRPQRDLPPPSTPIQIPLRRADTLPPSSVESLSSSYMERMDSRFRSFQDPQLVEIRRLREEQDAELARSLQEDRERERKEHDEANRKALVKEHMLNAAARLPDEPPEDSQCLTIAVRLSGGKRITRRFKHSDMLQSIADFVIAESGIIALAKAEPCLALKSAGAPLKRVSWHVQLSELSLSNRTMFTLNEAVLL
ncbi:UBX domain-containing protein 5 [Gracilariopsis chorda]|uniref:UBX domain-containing protein 5 n=1 Tax=Gracilariopsis chorda TaxID=448386 RepID=A0A2V3J0Y4_9FLOR|nr:UBX domain-containing protein 5 [Gracilariopsis chorda]|eukprot:PXF48066.1 UBX domain-containing protein 5 [Gracilariopsis chorda]